MINEDEINTGITEEEYVEQEQEVLSIPLHASRYVICKQCDSFMKRIRVCRECYCFMPGKVRIDSAHCPVGLW